MTIIVSPSTAPFDFSMFYEHEIIAALSDQFWVMRDNKECFSHFAYFKIYRPKHEKAAVPEEDYSEELADYDDPEDDGPPWDEDDTESEDNE